MSDRRVLVCFLDRAASSVERREIEDDVSFLAASGRYLTCLLCCDCAESLSWGRGLRDRLSGGAATDLVVVEYAIGEGLFPPWFDAPLFGTSFEGSSVDVLLPGRGDGAGRRRIERELGALAGTCWVWVSGSTERRVEREGMGWGAPADGGRGRDGPDLPEGRTRGGRASAREDFEGLIERVSRFDDIGVLIQGETGTGKTMLARKIHADGPRSRGPLVEVNCACIPSGMIESELFGHVRGAYTGANAERLGKIRSADGGTLFLDEVGELGLDIQVRLLKVLEDGAVVPLGSERPIRVDVRILAATNRDLPSMVKAGAFRFDLYSRLNQVCVRLPPLRGRRDEIVGVAERTLSRWNENHGERKFFTPAALTALQAFEWPGNYRQLIHAVHCACVRSGGAGIEALHLPLNELDGHPAVVGALPPIPEGGINLKEVLSCHEWAYYRRALMQSGWRPGNAARLLGMTAHAFRKALRERHAQRYQEMMKEPGETED